MQHRDGSERILEVNLRPVTIQQGERRLSVTSRDVTQRVESERALAACREQLEILVEERTQALQQSIEQLKKTDRLAAIGTLATGIAHQINNPIGSIQLSSEFALLAEGEVDEREFRREALESAIEQSRRYGEIVSSILQFARNESTENYSAGGRALA